MIEHYGEPEPVVEPKSVAAKPQSSWLGRILAVLLMAAVVSAAAISGYRTWFPKHPPGTSPVTQMVEDTDETAPWCDMILRADDFSQLVCIDQQGKYMPGIRQANVFFDVNGKPPVVRLYKWLGVYKPTSPQIEDWKVRKVQVMSAEEFQKVVDQSDVSP